MDTRYARTLDDGLDGYGERRTFVQQFPTLERLRHAETASVVTKRRAPKAGVVKHYDEPENSRDADLRHYRFHDIFRSAEDAGTIDDTERCAGQKFQAAVHGYGKELGIPGMKIASYGGSSGGSEVERRDRARVALKEARGVLGGALYSWLYAVAQDSLTSDLAPVPPTLKHRDVSDRTVRRHYAKTLQTALGRLAKIWR